jgi:hypothetical protein
VLFGAQGEDADLIERAVQTRLQEVEGDRDEGVTVRVMTARTRSKGATATMRSAAWLVTIPCAASPATTC